MLYILRECVESQRGRGVGEWAEPVGDEGGGI